MSSRCNAHGTSIRAAKRAQVKLRLFFPGYRNVEMVENTVISIVQRFAAIRCVNAFAIEVALVVREQDVDDAVGSRIIGALRAQRAVTGVL